MFVDSWRYPTVVQIDLMCGVMVDILLEKEMWINRVYNHVLAFN
jgi:hypothetical protein